MTLRRRLFLGGLVLMGFVLGVLLAFREPPLPEELKPLAGKVRLISEQKTRSSSGFSVVRIYSIHAPADRVFDLINHDGLTQTFPMRPTSERTRIIGGRPFGVANSHSDTTKGTGQILWAARIEPDQDQPFEAEDGTGWCTVVDLSNRPMDPFEAAIERFKGWMRQPPREDPEPPLVIVNDATSRLEETIAKLKTAPDRHP